MRGGAGNSCQAGAWTADNEGGLRQLARAPPLPPPPCQLQLPVYSSCPPHTCTRGSSAPAGFQSWVGGRSDEGTASGRQSCAAKRQQRAREWTTTPQCSQDCN